MPLRSALRADAPHYTVENLGGIGGGVPTITGINASGQVSGDVVTATGTHAVRYTPGTGWEFLHGLDVRFSVANGINASGESVTTRLGWLHARIPVPGWFGRRGHRAIPGNFSQGFGINDDAVIVGVSSDVSGIAGFRPHRERRPLPYRRSAAASTFRAASTTRDRSPDPGSPVTASSAPFGSSPARRT